MQSFTKKITPTVIKSIVLSIVLMGLMLGGITTAYSQNLKEQVNRGTVSIVSGGINGTYVRIASDLSNVLDNDDVRILAILGKGSIKNMEDLIYLKGIDLTIVQSDVLEFLKRDQIYQSIDQKIRYVTKLYNEEFHLLGTNDIANIKDLGGKKVNFGGKRSGTAMTTSLIFEALGIEVNPTYFDQATALEKLKTGEISALSYVAGKPTRLFKDIAASDNLRFVAIDPSPKLFETYLPATLSGEDYPNLVAASEEVNTVAVGAVMATFRWRPGTPRHDKVARFVNRFFDGFEQFLQAPRHPKWREVSLSAIVPGWSRFDTAEKWLSKQGASSGNSATTH